MISDWPLPVKAKSLNSFIGLVTFYNKFVPWFEHRLRPLRSLERLFHRCSIPIVDLRTFDEVVWSATYPSETDV